MYTWKAEVTLWCPQHKPAMHAQVSLFGREFSFLTRFPPLLWHASEAVPWFRHNYVILDFMTCSPCRGKDAKNLRKWRNSAILLFAIYLWLCILVHTDRTQTAFAFALYNLVQNALLPMMYIYIYNIQYPVSGLSSLMPYAFCSHPKVRNRCNLPLACARTSGVFTTVNFLGIADHSEIAEITRLVEPGFGNLGVDESWKVSEPTGPTGLEPYMKPLSVGGCWSNPTAATDLGLCAVPHMTKSLERNQSPKNSASTGTTDAWEKINERSASVSYYCLMLLTLSTCK